MSLISEGWYLLKIGARSLEMVIVSVTRNSEVGIKMFALADIHYIYISAKKSVMSYREKTCSFFVGTTFHRATAIISRTSSHCPGRAEIPITFQHVLSRRSQFSTSHHDLESEKD